MPPGNDLVVLVEAGFETLRRHGVVEIVLDVVLAGPHHLDRRAAIAFDSSAASSAKSHFDLRPKPPPSSVTLHRHVLGRQAERLAMSSRAPPGL